MESGGIFTSALDGDEWSASRRGSFTSGEKARYPLDRRLGEPQSRSRCSSEEEKSLPLPGIEPRSSSSQRSHYTDWAIPALKFADVLETN
jgi:hypothetical protein